MAANTIILDHVSLHKAHTHTTHTLDACNTLKTENIAKKSMFSPYILCKHHNI